MSALDRSVLSILSIALVSLALSAPAHALDELVKRDLDAFTSYEVMRCQSLDQAIAARDRESAKSLATRLQQEECRFLERMVRYLRDDKKRDPAGELESFLTDYRGMSLRDTVRVRRSAGPGHYPVIDMALAALTGQHLMGPPPPGFAPQQPAGTQVPSAPYSPSTASLSNPPLAIKRTPGVVADLQDGPVLASNHSSSVNLDGLRSNVGSSASSADASLASNIRKPTSATASGADPVLPAGPKKQAAADDASDGSLASGIRKPGPAAPR